VIAPDTLQLRAMLADDIDQVVAIELDVTPDPWRRAQFEQSLELHQCLILSRRSRTADRDAEAGRVLGYLVLSTMMDQSEVLNIAIDPQCQGQGLGSQLLRQGLELVPESVEAVLLEVRVSNFAAIRLYLNHGFIEVGRRRDYYKTEFGREDAILMTLAR
jgi:[ribosomal protein S18]-alanine N-acetyltransferase